MDFLNIKTDLELCLVSQRTKRVAGKPVYTYITSENIPRLRITVESVFLSRISICRASFGYPDALFLGIKLYQRVGRLCRDGVEAQHVQYVSKRHKTDYRYAKSLFKTVKHKSVQL